MLGGVWLSEPGLNRSMDDRDANRIINKRSLSCCPDSYREIVKHLERIGRRPQDLKQDIRSLIRSCLFSKASLRASPFKNFGCLYLTSTAPEEQVVSAAGPCAAARSRRLILPTTR